MTLLRIAVSCWLALAASCKEEQRVLPVISHVPAFALTDQRGKAFDNGRLEGRLWIVDFIFTSCPDTCPLLTRSMGRVQKRLAGHGDLVQFVSFTVDPETDTPNVLAAYAQQHEADQKNWSFVTGEPESVRSLIVGGFKQAMDRVPPKDGKPFNILHGSHFVLVDGAGKIRGFYRTDSEGLEGLISDVDLLAKDSG